MGEWRYSSTILYLGIRWMERGGQLHAIAVYYPLSVRERRSGLRMRGHSSSKPRTEYRFLCVIVTILTELCGLEFGSV
jgi:hypothetical protein